MLTIDDPASPGIEVIVADDAPAGTSTAVGATTHADFIPVKGFVNYCGGFGPFPVIVLSAVSKPLIGTPEDRILHTAGVFVGPGTLEFRTSVTSHTVTSQPAHTYCIVRLPVLPRGA